MAGVLAAALGGLPPVAAWSLTAYGLLALLLYDFRPRLAPWILASAAPAVAVLAWFGRGPVALLAAAASLALLAAIAREGVALREDLAASRRVADELGRALERRSDELATLEELSLVLSGALQPDHIVDQVVRYTRRFLQVEGAAVVLSAESGMPARVAAAEGVLSPLAGQPVSDDATALLQRALCGETWAVEGQGQSAPRLDGLSVPFAAAVPLRAHGITLGALVVAGGHAPSPGNLQLLATVAAHAAVVLANSRFFDLIRRSKEEWETTFEALAEGIAVVGPDGRISRANQALGRLLEIPRPALVGRLLLETAAGRSEAARSVIAAARRGEHPGPVLTRLESPGRVLRLTAEPFPQESGPRRPVVLLVEDVTEQRTLETQLIQSEKLAAVGQLVSGVAHELNNPLTSIAGLAEFLLEQGAGAVPREHLQVIHQQAERAGRIVRDLLAFARKGGHAMEPVDLNDLIVQTARLIEYEVRQREITLTLTLAPGPIVVRGDRYELQQVLLNLLTNALQAVSDQAEHHPRRITVVSRRREPDQAEFCVSDNGPGIPSNLLPQIFTPFFTTKEPGSGTGLGLSISYGIVQSHGGRLSYEPAVEGGASFLATLPLHGAGQGTGDRG